MSDLLAIRQLPAAQPQPHYPEMEAIALAARLHELVTGCYPQRQVDLAYFGRLNADTGKMDPEPHRLLLRQILASVDTELRGRP